MIAFIEAMRSFGLEPPEFIEPGRIHRFPGVGKSPSNRAAWCRLFEDGKGGCFGDWSSGLNEVWQSSGNKRPALSDRLKKILRTKKTKSIEEQHAEAALTATRIWRQSEPGLTHPYLESKGICPHGVRIHKGLLVVPLREYQILRSLQFISPAGEKKFLKHGKVAGCYFAIGQPESVLCIAEGFATASSIYEATGYAVAVAFNAGNLKAVARTMREMFSNLPIIVCADNDAETEGNPGLTKATEAAQAIGAFLAVPDQGDFNDLHRREGLESVKSVILSTDRKVRRMK